MNMPRTVFLLAAGLGWAVVPSLRAQPDRVRLVTAELVERGEVEVEVVTQGRLRTRNAPERRLFDGNIEGSAISSGTPLILREGATVDVCVRFPAPRLLQEVQLLYLGHARTVTTKLDLNSDDTLTVPHTAADTLELRGGGRFTSCRRWPALHTVVRGVHLSVQVSADNTTTFQFPELRLLGRRDPAEAPGDRLDILVDDRLPAVNQSLVLTARLARRSAASPAYRALRAELVDRVGKVLRTDEHALPELAPGIGADINWAWTLPAVPDWYTVRVHAVAGGEAPPLTAERRLPVTAHKLHCVWYGIPAHTDWGTAYCAVSDAASIMRLREQGILPLAVHMATFDKKDIRLDPDKLDYWMRYRRSYNPVGMAVDEFSSYVGNQSEEVGNALIRMRQEFPDYAIYVWAVGSRETYLPALRRAADLVMEEVYLNRLGNDFESFDKRIGPFYEHGLAHKTVIGIGTDLDETAEGVEKQLRYIRRKFPELPGLAVYKAYSDAAELVGPTDEMFFRFFVAPLVYVRPHPMYEQRVQVRNLGGLTARGVRVELLSKTTSAGGVDLDVVYPDTTHQIDWLEAIPELKPDIYACRVVPPEGTSLLNTEPVELFYPKTAQLLPAADATVDLRHPDRNNGDGQLLIYSGMRAYATFDAAALGPVAKVKRVRWGVWRQTRQYGKVELYGLPGDAAWDAEELAENAITATNAPGLTDAGELVPGAIALHRGKLSWGERLDVTEFVRKQLTAEQPARWITFMFRPAPGCSKPADHRVYSRTAEEEKRLPYLTVEYLPAE